MIRHIICQILNLGVDDAQQWVFDDESGHIVARGIELALTAGTTDVTLAEPSADDEDDDKAAQKWHVALTGHVLLLRNGKSLAFAYAKEGMPVRVMPTSMTVAKQVWVFGATPSPTAVPTHAPTRVPQPNHSAAGEHKSWWPVIVSALAAVLVCGGVGWWALSIIYGDAPAPPSKDLNKKAKKKRRKVISKEMASAGKSDELDVNPFESRGEVEMSAMTDESGEEDDDDDDEDGDDTAPLVAPNEGAPGSEVSGNFGLIGGWLSNVRALFAKPEGGVIDTALPGDEEEGNGSHEDTNDDLDQKRNTKHDGNEKDNESNRGSGMDDWKKSTTVFAEGDEFVSFRDVDDDEDGILEGEDLEPAAPPNGRLSSAGNAKSKRGRASILSDGGGSSGGDGGYDNLADSDSGGAPEGYGEISGDEANPPTGSERSSGREGKNSSDKRIGGKKKKKEKVKKGAKAGKGSSKKSSDKGKSKDGSSEEDEESGQTLPPPSRRGKQKSGDGGSGSSEGSSSSSSESEDDLPACMRGGDFSSPKSSSSKGKDNTRNRSSSGPADTSPERARGPTAFGGKNRRAPPTKNADEAMLDDFVA